MERYHLEDEIKTGKRTNMNKELYSKVYSSNTNFHTELVELENSSVVDIMKVRELINSRETQNKENYITKITDSINTDINATNDNIEDNKKYDINTAIEIAKRNKNKEDEKNKYRKLSDTIFLKLDEIKKEQKKQQEEVIKNIIDEPIEELNNELLIEKEKEVLIEKINNTNAVVDEKLDNENEKLTKLINKISEKNQEKLSETAKVSLDILSNLAPSDDSIILSGVDANIKSMLDTNEELDEEKYEETLIKTLYKPLEKVNSEELKNKDKKFEFDVDKTFYTKSMNFNRKDFEIKKESTKINKFLNFLLFIIILIIIALLVFLLLKFL